MKKYIINNATEVIDTGENKNKHLAQFVVHGPDSMEVSDGSHTIEELYEHRNALYITVCKFYSGQKTVWRSLFHADGSNYEGWFILGIGLAKGEQITYHLPMKEWHNTEFATTLPNAPEWDNHTPADVVMRLKTL